MNINKTYSQLSLKEIMERHNIKARKSLGQHFLFNQNLTRRIAKSSGDLSGINVIEIGAGPGGLTRSLLETKALSVVAIERDKKCISALEELQKYSKNRLSIIEGDALNINLINLTPHPRRIIANLPYNIATQLLINWLKQANEYRGFTLMFQREVAERITAKPNSKSYGRLSIICQWLTDARKLFDIAPSSFFPQPSVTSSVIAMETRKMPLASADMNKLELVTRLAFGQRRKMLRRSLQSIGGSDLLLKANIQETFRAEELTVEQYCDLANFL
jgi:16S rRNA (adenine1518-N6/adenine1519-N6)-dimethyltransferase